MTDQNCTTEVTRLPDPVESAPLALPSTLLVRRLGSVWHVTLNRPAQRNAMSAQMAAELRAVLDEAQASPQARVIVLRGAGGQFCAGDEVADWALPPDTLGSSQSGLDSVTESNAALGALYAALADSALAVVVVVEGAAAASGIALACVADVVIAGQHTTFGLQDAAHGMVPAQLAGLLVERLGYAQARRLAVTGGTLDANGALALGLVHQVHASGALDLAVANLLRTITRNAPGAVAATKRLMAQSRQQSASERINSAAVAFSTSIISEEAVEGRLASLQKRKPAWAGA